MYQSHGSVLFLKACLDSLESKDFEHVCMKKPWHCFSSMLAVIAEVCEDSFIMYHENVSSNFKKYLCTDKTGYFGSDFTHSSSEDEDMDIPILEQFHRQHLEVFSVNLTKNSNFLMKCN